MSETLRLLILGAHPDDAEYHAGGLAAIYRRLGHAVKMISLTSGDAGHHEMRGPELAARRRREAAAAGAVIGAETSPGTITMGCCSRRWSCGSRSFASCGGFGRTSC